MRTSLGLSASKTALVGFLVAVLTFMPVLQVMACAPEYPVAVIVNWIHPDLPLKIFAAGNLGVVQSSWARSYLCVVYRYLTNMPLSGVQQAGILRLWHSRLGDAVIASGDDTYGRIESYIDLRDKILGVKTPDSSNLYGNLSDYCSKQNIQGDAFVLAKRKLQALVKQYGAKSDEVRDWLKAQDCVFGIDVPAATIPKPLSAVTNAALAADRDYQIAAATLYAGDLAKAATLFGQMAADKTSPWAVSAAYLVGRCKANIAMSSNQPDDLKAALTYLEAMLVKETNLERRQDILDLMGPLKFSELSFDQLVASLVKSVTSPDSERFGRDVGDLTFEMDTANSGSDGDDAAKSSTTNRVRGAADDESAAGDEKPKPVDFTKYDLTDWLETIQHPYDYWGEDDSSKEAKAKKLLKTQHAVAMWRKNHSLPWLVAVMLCNNGLRSPQLKDALEAAKNIPDNSAAYLTARFYVIDALIASNHFQDARQNIKAILTRTDLPPSTRNLFQAQLVRVSSTLDELLHAAFMSMPEVSSSQLLLPSDWSKLEQQSKFHTKGACVDHGLATDINRNLPLSDWLKLCKDKSIEPALRKRIIWLSWVRAQLLDRQDVIAALTDELAAAYPPVTKLVNQYKATSLAEAKRYAVARLMLHIFGITPYLEEGVARHGTEFGSFDYYNANYWLPLKPQDQIGKKGDGSGDDWMCTIAPPAPAQASALMQEYYKAGLDRLLSKQQQQDAAHEREAIWKNHPSKFLGEAVFAWAKSHPKDAEVPEMLYRVVRLPKWCGSTPVGSAYSHQAYVILHSQYPHNAWTTKAVCWY